MEECKDCKFFWSYHKKLGKAPDAGCCRRNPPQIFIDLNSTSDDYGEHLIGIGSEHHSLFPDISAGAWCGEFKAKESKI